MGTGCRSEGELGGLEEGFVLGVALWVLTETALREK